MAMFNSYVSYYQRVNPINIPLNHYKIPLNHYKIPLNHDKIPLNHDKIPLNHDKIPLNHDKIPLNHYKIPLNHYIYQRVTMIPNHQAVLRAWWCSFRGSSKRYNSSRDERYADLTKTWRPAASRAALSMVSWWDINGEFMRFIVDSIYIYYIP